SRGAVLAGSTAFQAVLHGLKTRATGILKNAIRSQTLHILLSLLILCELCPAAELPGPTLPDGLGVNIHFTDARPGELEMLAAAGFKFVRMDFDWARIETK